MNGVSQLIEYCGGLKPNERLLIIYDGSTADMVDLFILYAAKITKYIGACKVDVSTVHGQEPPDEVAKKMMSADLILCLTQSSLAHTAARKSATDLGCRFLSLPGYSKALLSNEALQFPFKNAFSGINAVCTKLNAGKRLKIISDMGTNVEMDIARRTGNCCPGYVDEAIKLGSPPDSEANIAPVEENSSGIIVVDGSITHPDLCKLNVPVAITVKHGKIVKFESDSAEYVAKLREIFDGVNSSDALILAECGIGFNRNAALCGNMLVDEGAYGCVHFGFGANGTIGGRNHINFHLDFVITKPTLFVDEEIIIQSGEILS